MESGKHAQKRTVQILGRMGYLKFLLEKKKEKAKKKRAEAKKAAMNRVCQMKKQAPLRCHVVNPSVYVRFKKP